MDIKTFLRKIQRKLHGKPPSYLMSENESYSLYEIGDYSYGYPQVISYNMGTTLKVGKFCSIAAGTTIILGGEHHTDWVSSYDFGILQPQIKSSFSRGDVIIGNDVWIGQDALILSGVTIGNGAICAARSVVTKDVAPYSIVGGVPARHIRSRFDSGEILALQRIQWWDWPLPEVLSAITLLESSDIAAFIDKYRQQK